MFKILFYCSDDSNGRMEDLRRVVDQKIPLENIEKCMNREELSEKLRDGNSYFDVAILAASSVQELDVFMDWKAYLKDMDLILIVPNNDEKALSIGHKLYPRHLAVVGNNFKYLGPILSNMIRRSETRNTYERKTLSS